jgi:hypothetical protein
MTNDTTAPDLIERLRESQRLYEEAGVDGSEGALQAKEAADALEAAQARIAELEGALGAISGYSGKNSGEWRNSYPSESSFIQEAFVHGGGHGIANAMSKIASAALEGKG